MKRLILMRHAKTEPWFAGGDDRGRALLPRGKSDAVLIGQEIEARGWAPDHVLLSSARRTRETWLAMSGILTASDHEVLDKLYLAGTSHIQSVIEEHETHSTLMLIGHNPGMHDYAAQVSSLAGTVNQKAAMTLATKMPTAAAALFEADEDQAFRPSVFRLIDYILAKPLRP